MIVGGIDNGLEGGLVFLVEGEPLVRQVVPTLQLPKSGKTKSGNKRWRTEIDEHAVVRLLERWRPDVVGLEVAQPMNKRRGESGQEVREGSVQAFSTGLGWGVMRGALAALKIKVLRAPVRSWQVAMFSGHLRVKGDSKQLSVAVAQALWPDVDWRESERCRKAHTGLTDAALIAEWTRRQVEGGYVVWTAPNEADSEED